MRMNATSKVLTFLASLLLASTAVAAEGTSERFQQLDVDGDGRISAAEASRDPELSSSWDQIEKKENGYLDRSEFSAFEEQTGGESEPGAMQ
jgi:Ca2+-binding EF-hand superfamily protein